MRFCEDGKSWLEDWVDFVPATTYTLGSHPVAPVTPGLKKVYVQFRDVGLKVSKTYFDTITYTDTVDSALPGTMTINGGKDSTKSTAVTLEFTPPAGEGFARLSNDKKVWGKWLSTASAASWKLSSGDGVKTMYAQYSLSSAAGQAPPATTYRAGIILDTIAPSGWLLINNGASVTGSATVDLTMGASDVNGVSKMCIKETSVVCLPEEFKVYDTVKTDYVIQSPGDGIKSIYISYKDSAGNVSKPVKAVITLDTLAPTGSITINGGKPTTTIPLVSVKLTASKAVYMQLSINGVPNELEAFAKSKDITLTSGGINTISVTYRDFAGNESKGDISATITLLDN
jgi:hypothetical protein